MGERGPSETVFVSQETKKGGGRLVIRSPGKTATITVKLQSCGKLAVTNAAYAWSEKERGALWFYGRSEVSRGGGGGAFKEKDTEGGAGDASGGSFDAAGKRTELRREKNREARTE